MSKSYMPNINIESNYYIGRTFLKGILTSFVCKIRAAKEGQMRKVSEVNFLKRVPLGLKDVSVRIGNIISF